jgi:hypothetical protein
MTYLYRVVVDDVDETAAAKDMNAVWTPEAESETWVEYIERIKSTAH